MSRWNQSSRTVAGWRHGKTMGRSMLFSAILMLALSMVPLGSVYAAGAQNRNLFITLHSQTSLTTFSSKTVIRARNVTIDISPLGAADAGPVALSKSVTLNLFDDVNLSAIQDRTEINSSGSVTWSGHVDGVADSLVTLVTKDGVMVGSVQTPKELYRVGYVGDGVHVISELDQAAFPECLPPTPVELTPEQTADARVEGGDDGSVIDIMVVYTDDARAAAGGTTAIENTIDLAVSESHTGYGNSNINTVLNLVHTAEVSYAESGDIQTDHDRLQNPTDGYIDQIHTWRDTHGADMVALITENGGGYCGIAFFMETVSTAFADYAFQVTVRNCATGYYSFAHEFGHIQSARHDWYVDSTNNSPYTYNHGYVDPGNAWRTVMAYGNDCNYCTRVNYWSNPNVLMGGIPMGVPDGASQAAENWKTLNSTAWTVANFRTSAPPAFMLTAPASGSTLTSPPLFEWSAGPYNLFYFYSAFNYTGAGIVPYGFWLTSDSLQMPANWWSLLSESAPSYWAVIGLSTTTSAHELSDVWSFTKGSTPTSVVGDWTQH